MEKTSIRIIDPPSNIPSHYFTDGKLYLDLPVDFKLRLTKLLEELTDLNKITQQAALSFAVKQTDKNTLILERFDINVFDGEPDPVYIEIDHAGNRVQFDRMVVVDYGDSSSEYEIEIFGGGWIDDLSDTLLRDLSLPLFHYTNQEINSAWSFDQSFAFPAVCHYGGWNTPGNVTKKDLRFWFNINKLLKYAFAAIGWTFKSTYFEANGGNKIVAYLSGEKWFSYTGKQDPFRVEAGAVTPIVRSGNLEIVSLQDIFDPNGLYDEFPFFGSYKYALGAQSPTFLNIRVVDLTFTLPQTPAGQPLGELFFGVSRNGVEDFFYGSIRPGSYDQDTTIVVNESFVIDDCLNGDEFQIWVGHKDFTGAQTTNYPLTIESGSVFFEPDRSFYIEDDMIPLNELIDETISALDLLKAGNGLIDGKFSTDYASRIVYHYPTATGKMLGNNIEGYFLNNAPPIDITDKVLVNSRDVKVLENKQARYIDYKFKNASDAYIKSLEGKSQPYSRTVDLGKGTIKPKKFENFLFEPTMEVKTTPAEVGTGLTDTVFLPALWDNTDGNISNKIKPRVAFCHAIGAQFNSDGTTALQLMYEGNVRNDFGYVSQSPSQRLAGNSSFLRLIYGIHSEDLFNSFLKYTLSNRFPKYGIEFLVRLTFSDYLDYDFRYPYGFYYRDTFLTYQMLSIKDFNLGGTDVAPFAFNLID